MAVFQQFIRDPNLPDRIQGGSTLGSALQVLSQTVESGLVVRDIFQVNETRDELAEVQQQAQAGADEFLNLTQQISQGLDDRDKQSIMDAEEQLRRLQRGQEQGKLTPSMARTRAASIINEAAAVNPRISSQVRSLGAALNFGTGGASQGTSIGAAAQAEEKLQEVMFANGFSSPALALNAIVRAERDQRTIAITDAAIKQGQADLPVLREGVQALANTIVAAPSTTITAVLNGGNTTPERKSFLSQSIDLLATASSSEEQISAINTIEQDLILKEQQIRNAIVSAVADAKRGGSVLTEAQENALQETGLAELATIRSLVNNKNPLTIRKNLEEARKLNQENQEDIWMKIIQQRGFTQFLQPTPQAQQAYQRTIERLAGFAGTLTEEEIQARAITDQTGDIGILLRHGRESLLAFSQLYDDFRAGRISPLGGQVAKIDLEQQSTELNEGSESPDENGGAEADLAELVRKSGDLAFNPSQVDSVWDDATVVFFQSNKEAQQGYRDIVSTKAVNALRTALEGLSGLEDGKIVIQSTDKWRQGESNFNTGLTQGVRLDTRGVAVPPTVRLNARSFDAVRIVGTESQLLSGARTVRGVSVPEARRNVAVSQPVKEFNDVIANLSTFMSTDEIMEFIVNEIAAPALRENIAVTAEGFEEQLAGGEGE